MTMKSGEVGESCRMPYHCHKQGGHVQECSQFGTWEPKLTDGQRVLRFVLVLGQQGVVVGLRFVLEWSHFNWV